MFDGCPCSDQLSWRGKIPGLAGGPIERLTDAAKGNRYGHRDATMVLVAYKHGLRASELVDLTSTTPRWRSVGPRGAPRARILSAVTNCCMHVVRVAI
jgi:site-specific recombinase XerC